MPLSLEEDLFPPELEVSPERTAVGELAQYSLQQDDHNYLEIRFATKKNSGFNFCKRKTARYQFW